MISTHQEQYYQKYPQTHLHFADVAEYLHNQPNAEIFSVLTSTTPEQNLLTALIGAANVNSLSRDGLILLLLFLHELMLTDYSSTKEWHVIAYNHHRTFPDDYLTTPSAES